MIQEPAFELLRQFKNVSTDTELLTMKVVKKRYSHLSPQDLYNIFEMGIQGEFGKLYSADPQTLIGWVDEYCKKQSKRVSYYEKPILPPSVKITDREYPTNYTEWQKEINKCYTAFLGGTPVTHFHPDIYFRLQLDGRIQLNDYKEFYTTEDDWDISRIRVIERYFTYQKMNGANQIYHV